MSTFSGQQGKGALRRHRDQKRKEAEARNASAEASLRSCGHVHGIAQGCSPGVGSSPEDRLLAAIFGRVSA